jgi:hypothetical protein
MRRAALVLGVGMLLVASVSASARPAASGACHVPRLTGLTLSIARERARHAKCKLRVEDAAPEQPEVQTVERQSPPRGRRSSKVYVWLNPLCNGSAAYGPELSEPLITTGPTELVSGFYLDGGPLTRFSDPACKRPAPKPGAGTVEVTNASGAEVATQSSAGGHFVEILLPPGTYMVTGTFLGATINGVHPKQSESVVIPPGHTVRQDFFLDIP